MSFEALKQALSSAPVLLTFDPRLRAVLTTDASSLAVAAILTQPGDEGHQHPVAYESSKLTTAERNYPAHVLELLAMVHDLRIFRHYLLGTGAPRAEGCWSDFDLRTDNQAIKWLKTTRHLNKMYVRWLDEIEDFRFHVTHVQGPGIRRIRSRVAASRTVMALPPRRATRSPRVNRKLFSRHGLDSPPSSLLATVWASWGSTRRVAAATFAVAREVIPPEPRWGV